MNLQIIDGFNLDLQRAVGQAVDRFDPTRLLGIWQSPLIDAVRRREKCVDDAAGWLAFIDGLSGVSDELEFSWIHSWLRWVDRPIAAEEIIDFLDEYGAKIHVVRQRAWTTGRPWLVYRDPDCPERLQTTARLDRAYGCRYGFQLDRADLFDPPELQGRWVMRYRAANREKVHQIMHAEDALDVLFHSRAVAWNGCNVGGGRRGRYGFHALGGGGNYREILFVMPSWHPPFKQRHFPLVNNVLFHIRLTDRLSEDGASFLHIEEIQSDWRNPRNGGPNFPFRRHWLRIGLAWCIQEALDRSMAGVSLSDGAIHTARYGANLAVGLGQFYQHVESHLRRCGKRAGGQFRNVSFMAWEPRYFVGREATQWVIADMRHKVVQEGFETRSAAETAMRALQPPKRYELPAVLLDPAQAAAQGWQRAFIRTDGVGSAPASIAVSDETRCDAILSFTESLLDEVTDALALVVQEYFGEVGESICIMRKLIDECAELPRPIHGGLIRQVEELSAIRRGEHRQAPAGRQLDHMQMTLRRLRRYLRANGEPPDNWQAIAPVRIEVKAVHVGAPSANGEGDKG